MELICFSQQTLPKSPGSRNQVPWVSFTKHGSIRFNDSAGRLIGFKDGCKVSIAQDKKEPENWYVFLDDNGYVIKDGGGGKGWSFGHRELVRLFIDAANKDKSKTHRFLIAGKPTVLKDSKVKYWGILVPQ